MPNTLPRIIIGIPALNEEKNIGALLKDIAAQNCAGFKISEIIVNSDGSTDKTETVALSATKLPVTVLSHKERKGIAVRLNEVLAKARKEKVTAVILFDADIRILDKNCLKNLLAPILKNNVDLTSCKISELPTTNLVDRSLKVSMAIKHALFSELNNGDNVYTCYGPVRAFSARLVEKLSFPYGIGNDAFSYLFTKQHGLKYHFVRNTEIIYKLPTDLSDHENQSQRFLESQKLLAKDFGAEFVHTEYQIPTTLKLKSVLSYLVKEPVLVITYLSILLSMQVKHFTSNGVPDLWDQATSSKTLNHS